MKHKPITLPYDDAVMLLRSLETVHEVVRVALEDMKAGKINLARCRLETLAKLNPNVPLGTGRTFVNGEEVKEGHPVLVYIDDTPPPLTSAEIEAVIKALPPGVFVGPMVRD